jgi:predicted nuclease of predicted toxin-antitoxin system
MKDKGFDVIHTDNLPNKEKTSDIEIRIISIEQERIVISKDSDFLDSHIIVGIPRKFLYISTGNIINRELFSLVEKHLPQIIDLFDNYDLIELSNEELIVHEK